jgi:hypothetical protein
MPPILIPPLARIAIGALGAGAAMHWIVKEVRRINAELDRVSKMPPADASERHTFPTLRRDPRTGDWRVT